MLSRVEKTDTNKVSFVHQNVQLLIKNSDKNTTSCLRNLLTL